MPEIKAVIFDMDGVLIDSLPAHYRSYVRLFSSLGIKYTFKQFIRDDITSGATNVIPKILKQHGRKGDVTALLREKNRLIESQNVRLNAGVRRLLAGLRKKDYRTAVATGGTREYTRYILKKNGIGKYFTAVVTGQDARKKPHPDIFLKAARKLKVKPAECLVIEDSCDGVTAARRAKMKVIGHCQPRYKQDLSKANKVVGSMARISMKMIEKL